VRESKTMFNIIARIVAEILISLMRLLPVSFSRQIFIGLQSCCQWMKNDGLSTTLGEMPSLLSDDQKIRANPIVSWDGCNCVQFWKEHPDHEAFEGEWK